ncbi:ABC transporter ATP-binding protein (plasmid) [Lactiplantibacillus plantarum]|nr:ABC transporter ATP-binding protein [Lactiplantibacillus plantarum]QAB24967.1 ABC transporter ATP-binding protein [Lactiplantibacillus plantarum]RXS84721.1 ABC transporter ATP-binding protein [Lactiplantibacillus plantarum]
MVDTLLKEADLFCPNSVRINFTIYQTTNTNCLIRSIWSKHDFNRSKYNP